MLTTAEQVAIIGYAGWLVPRRGIGGIQQAALIGAGMSFMDQVVLTGGIFLLNYLRGPEGTGLAAFNGVMVSFLPIAPLSAETGAAGVVIAGRQRDAHRCDRHLKEHAIRRAPATAG